MKQKPTQKELNLSSIQVALYPRVSTQEQAVNGYSIDEQIERMTKFCEAMNWTVYKIYTDAGYSGANKDRPALQQMIKDVKKGKVDKVLVYKLDRLSRSQKDTLELIEDVFLANNVDFVSMNENFDTSTAFGRAMVGILAVFAQLEREQIKERMVMGQQARAKKGLFHGSCMVPIGYDYVDGKLITNDFEKIQIQKMFEMYASGKGGITITRELNDAGYSHKYGKWSRWSVNELIKKRTYLGYTYYNGEWYKGEHEAFIDEDLFNKCQVILEQRCKSFSNNLRLGKANSYLSGHLICSCCGAKYGKYTKTRNGKKYEYYSCYSRTQKNRTVARDPNCKNKNWKMAELDALVFDEIKKLALDPDYVSEIKASNTPDDRPQIIEAEIEKLESQINRLLDLYTIGQIPVDTLQDRIQSLNEKKATLESELSKIEDEAKDKVSHENTMELVKSFGDILDRGDIDEIRTVIGGLIDTIEINGDDITIKWAFA